MDAAAWKLLESLEDNPHLTTSTQHVMVGITRSKVIWMIFIDVLFNVNESYRAFPPDKWFLTWFFCREVFAPHHHPTGEPFITVTNYWFSHFKAPFTFQLGLTSFPPFRTCKRKYDGQDPANHRPSAAVRALGASPVGLRWTIATRDSRGSSTTSSGCATWKAKINSKAYWKGNTQISNRLSRTTYIMQ